MRINKEIEVTQDDIKNGIKEDSQCCPIALALNRAFSNMACDKIQVEGGARITFDDGSRVELHTDEIKNFIADFDAGKPVEPFRFLFLADIEEPQYDNEEYEE